MITIREPLSSSRNERQPHAQSSPSLCQTGTTFGDADKSPRTAPLPRPDNLNRAISGPSFPAVFPE